jgi:electron transfer flavoprotein alpha subunit
VTLRGVTAKGTVSGNLETAERIVTGGRGVGSPEGFALIEQLAAALGASVGATRAVTDAGWRPHHEQIGQTGRSVKPKLYVAAGVSGAVQHLAGMRGSDTIIAINRDADAPIFRLAALGVVGDLNDIIPALIRELSDG